MEKWPEDAEGQRIIEWIEDSRARMARRMTRWRDSILLAVVHGRVRRGVRRGMDVVRTGIGDRARVIDPRIGDPPQHIDEGDQVDSPEQVEEVEVLRRWKEQWWLHFAQIPQRALDDWVAATRRKDMTWRAQMIADRICRAMRWKGLGGAGQFLKTSRWILTRPALRAALKVSRYGEVGDWAALTIICEQVTLGGEEQADEGETGAAEAETEQEDPGRAASEELFREDRDRGMEAQGRLTVEEGEQEPRDVQQDQRAQWSQQ